MSPLTRYSDGGGMVGVRQFRNADATLFQVRMAQEDLVWQKDLVSGQMQIY